MVKAESETLGPYVTKETKLISLAGGHLCPLYFTLLGPEPDQLANDG